MKNQQPILSLCIPTYNRAKMLDYNLKILSGFSKKNFVLIICDNGSTDDTIHVVNKWIEYFPLHKIIRHDKNILFDRNAASGLEEFDTEYCLLLGDGSLIDEASLQNLIQELETQSWDAVIIDVFGQVNKEPKVYTEINNLISEIGWYLPLLSASILSKKMCQRYILKRYFDTDFEHYGVLVEYLCTLDEFKVKLMNNVKMELNKAGDKSNGWRSHPFKTFGMNWFKFVMSFPEAVKLETKLKCIKDHDAHIHVFNVWSLFKAKLRGDVPFYDYKEARPFLPFVLNDSIWKYDFIYHFVPILSSNLVEKIKKYNKRNAK